MGIDRNRKRRYVASVLYSDIKQIEDTIKPIIEYYGETHISAAAVNILYDVVLKNKVRWNILTPLCEDNSPYHLLSKDIYFLDTDTVKSLQDFYNSILQADKEYIFYISHLDSPTNSKEYMDAWNIQDSIVNNLRDADKEAFDLADRLNLI